MSESKIRGEVLDLARRTLNLTGDLPDGALSERLDSLQRLTLVVAIEDHFSIIFEPEDEAGIDSIDAVVATIANKLGASR